MESPDTSSDPNQPTPSGHPVVDALAALEVGKKLNGNVVPHAWFKTITVEAGSTKKGKRKPEPDLSTIAVLSEIVYWYRPQHNYQGDGKWAYRKRFKADLLQLSRGQFENKLNLSKRQVSRCLARLIKMGVIKLDYRTIESRGMRLNNVLFIELVPERLGQLSTIAEPVQEGAVDTAGNASGHDGNTSCPQTHQPLTPQVTGLVTEGDSSCHDGNTNTEITAESTGEITSGDYKATTTTKAGGFAAPGVVDNASQHSGAAAPEPPPRSVIDPRPDTLNQGKGNSPVKLTPVQGGNLAYIPSRRASAKSGEASKVSKPAGSPAAPAAQSARRRGLAWAGVQPAKAQSNPKVITGSGVSQEKEVGAQPRQECAVYNPAEEADKFLQAFRLYNAVETPAAKKQIAACKGFFENNRNITALRLCYEMVVLDEGDVERFLRERDNLLKERGLGPVTEAARFKMLLEHLPQHENTTKAIFGVTVEGDHAKRIEQFQFLWCDCYRRFWESDYTITGKDRSAIDGGLRALADERVGTIVLNAIRAWSQSDAPKKNPDKTFDPNFYCRRSGELQWVLKYYPKLLMELPDAETPDWIDEILKAGVANWNARSKAG